MSTGSASNAYGLDSLSTLNEEEVGMGECFDTLDVLPILEDDLEYNDFDFSCFIVCTKESIICFCSCLLIGCVGCCLLKGDSWFRILLCLLC